MVGGTIKSVNTLHQKILKFCPCGKDRHRLNVLIVCGIKVSSMKAGGENGQKFFEENISSCNIIMVLILSNPLSLIVLKLIVQDKIGWPSNM